MKFSEQWLREWVDPAISTDELLAQLTMAGLEVDGLETAANPFTGVVVGEVLSVEKHPDADKLNVCQVSNGTETLQVVCGAKNVRAGLKIPYAQIGADLAPDFKIKKAKLRGVESFGMLCGADELGLADQSDGIMELPADAPTGQDFRDYLNLDDNIIEVDLTPNRGDCLSIAGLAREVGVLNKVSVNEPVIDAVPESIAYSLPVVLQSPQDCPRYLGRVIHGVNTKAESPVWMQEKLRRSGIRSIDPIVDVTNYVLIELGQPMHAFDFSKLEGGICVRRAKENEKLTLLDEREIELTEDTLVIADDKKALAMAGVMGGLESSVTENTKDIFLESAFFNPITIAGKARTYGMQTDAAHRFERGVDFNLPRKAMERATALLLDIVGGAAGPIVEASESLPQDKTVSLRAARIHSMLGVALPVQEVEDIFTRLGLPIIGKDELSWTFSVPSYRFDISIEADLIEELARIYGYNNLPVTEPLSRFKLKSRPEAKLGIKAIRSTLSTLGYQEVLTYSFVEPKLEASLTNSKAEAIALLNPISQDMSVMRSTLWTGMIKTLKHNQNRQQSRVRIFESGLVFFNDNNELQQVPKVGGMIWGSQLPEQWTEPEQELDFYDLKGDVESLLALTLDSASFTFEVAEHPALQNGRTARIIRENAPVGWLGALDPVLQRKLDIPGKVFLFELNISAIESASLPIAKELSKFPSVRRDLALTVPEALEFEAIKNLITEKAGEFLVETVIFDVFQGENIEKGQKSIALGLTFQHPSRTLKDDEINGIIDSCINALEEQFKAKLR